MLHRLKPPTYSDDEMTRIARIQHWLLLVLVIANVVDMWLLALLAPETLPTFWLNLVFLIFTLFVIFLNSTGHVYAGTMLLLGSFWLLTVYYLITSGGLHSPTVNMLFIIVIAASIPLGIRSVIFFGVINVLALIGLYVGSTQGWFVSQELPPTFERLLGTNTALMILATGLLSISVYSLTQALDRIRRHEASLVERNWELEQAQRTQARLIAILEATSDVVSMTTIDQQVIYLNAAGRRILGLRADAPIDDLHIRDFHPPDVYEQIVSNGLLHAAQGMWLGESTLRQHDGTDIPVSQMLLSHRNTQGEIDYYSTIMRDVRVQKRDEQNRLELALQHERVETYREFLSTLTHDLRTPLTTINTSLYLLEHMQEPEKRREKMDNITQQLALLETYFSELLTLTNLESLPELEFNAIELDALVEKVVERLRAFAETKRHQIITMLPADLPPAHANAQELSHALSNLIENAVHYTPEGGKITIRAVSERGGVTISVHDTGIGIAPEDQPRIFNRFYRADSARQERPAGTGLGLAIVKKVIDIHNGTIHVESAVGQGTVFHVWLPKHDPAL